MSTRTAPKVPYTALVGRILQHHRERLGLQQIEVANALGIMQPAYSRIEKGDTSITIAQLRVVARELNMVPARILNEADQWTKRLRAQGVVVTDEKEVPKEALLVGLGILAAVMLTAASR
jgi:transcriptional regulator with XRE-family HTH domain